MAVIRDLGPVTAYAAAVEGGYTGTKAEFETLMASYATVAEEAAESAESASQSATSASASASTATAKASEASQSATQAGAKASEASTSATQASASATSASQSAQTATTKASEASASASTASTKASEASASATSAQTAQGLAESAKDDAESARDMAQQYAESIDPDNIFSAYATDTASGAVATFADGADDIPVKSCVVAIEPVQDLHGYDHPWPAGGGKNLFDGYTANWKKWQLVNNVFTTRPDTYSPITFTSNEDGTVTVIAKGTFTGVAVEIESSDADRVFSVSGASYVGLFSAYEDGASKLNISHTYVTISAGVSGCIGIRFDAAGTYTIKCQLESGSTATDYAPYSNICPISGWTGAQVSHSGADMTSPTVHSITFPTEAGTVYGGTLDVTNGTLTVDRASIASYNGETLPSEWISDRDKYVAGTTPTTGAQVVYKLATPITYNLTPTEIKSLLGDNNLWANAGDTAVTYRADTAKYIDKKISEVINALS